MGDPHGDVHSPRDARDAARPSTAHHDAIDDEATGLSLRRTAIAQGAEVTKDALRIIAQAAPAPIAQNDVFQRLTGMGYKATDATRNALVSGVGAIEDATGGGVVKEVRDTGRGAIYEMNVAVAKQILKQLHGT